MTAPPITNVRHYKNTTAKGNLTATKVKRGVFYYSYGTKEQNPDLLPRGEWYSPHGAERYGDVAAWAAGNAVQHTYTYSLVLSLRDGPMQPDDFIDAMAGASEGIFADFRAIVHYDTDHDHAHVLAFRDTTLSNAEFHRWRKEAGRRLATAERQRLQELAADGTRSEGRTPSPGRAPTPGRAAGRKLEHEFDDDLAFAL